LKHHCLFLIFVSFVFWAFFPESRFFWPNSSNRNPMFCSILLIFDVVFHNLQFLFVELPRSICCISARYLIYVSFNHLGKSLRKRGRYM
jgi:hypothetical protein